MKEFIKSMTLNNLAGTVGLGAGAATATAVGTTIGSAGILGTLGSAVGLTVAVATPIGWILGGAALGGAAFYSASALISKKGYSEGDNKAYRKFNSDEEKKKFNEIKVKLLKKPIKIALNLVEKLPNIDFKADAKDGLEKGTMNVYDVIQVCCEYLNEDCGVYKNEKNLTIKNIESFIKISTLLAVIDKDYSIDEQNMIRKKVVEYFSLNEVLSESEIELVFKMANGSNSEIEEIKKLDFYSQMNLLHTFVLFEDDNELLLEINKFLKSLALVDNNVCKLEERLIMFYEKFLLSKKFVVEGEYDNALLKLNSSDDLYYISDNDDKNKKYTKKLSTLVSSKKAYAYCLSPQHVISIDDHTRFGSATDGCLFTPLGIFTNLIDSHFIPYYDLESNLDNLKRIFNAKPNDYSSVLFEEILKINKKLLSENKAN